MTFDSGVKIIRNDAPPRYAVFMPKRLYVIRNS
jgi:hypothetical protein